MDAGDCIHRSDICHQSNSRQESSLEYIQANQEPIIKNVFSRYPTSIAFVAGYSCLDFGIEVRIIVVAEYLSLSELLSSKAEQCLCCLKPELLR
jgi:hypothetical protein